MPRFPIDDDAPALLKVTVTVALVNGTPVLRADPPTVVIPKASTDVRLTFELVDQTQGSWTFLPTASHDANGDHYHGIEIHGDNGDQFIAPSLAPSTHSALTVVCENTRAGSYKYDIVVQNPRGERLVLDPTITNRGR